MGGKIMYNRYNKIVMEFFGAAELYAYRVYDEKYQYNDDAKTNKKATYIQPILDARKNWDKVSHNPDVVLGEFRLPLDTFTNKPGDYRVYYAFLNAYQAIMRYYRFQAKYNSQDIELDAALAEWKLAINQKTNILQKVMSKLVKKYQK